MSLRVRASITATTYMEAQRMFMDQLRAFLEQDPVVEGTINFAASPHSENMAGEVVLWDCDCEYNAP